MSLNTTRTMIIRATLAVVIVVLATPFELVGIDVPSRPKASSAGI